MNVLAIVACLLLGGWCECAAQLPQRRSGGFFAVEVPLGAHGGSLSASGDDPGIRWTVYGSGEAGSIDLGIGMPGGAAYLGNGQVMCSGLQLGAPDVCVLAVVQVNADRRNLSSVHTFFLPRADVTCITYNEEEGIVYLYDYLREEVRALPYQVGCSMSKSVRIEQLALIACRRDCDLLGRDRVTAMSVFAGRPGVYVPDLGRDRFTTGVRGVFLGVSSGKPYCIECRRDYRSTEGPTFADQFPALNRVITIDGAGGGLWMQPCHGTRRLIEVGRANSAESRVEVPEAEQISGAVYIVGRRDVIDGIGSEGACQALHRRWGVSQGLKGWIIGPCRAPSFFGGNIGFRLSWSIHKSGDRREGLRVFVLSSTMQAGAPDIVGASGQATVLKPDLVYGPWVLGGVAGELRVDGDVMRIPIPIEAGDPRVGHEIAFQVIIVDGDGVWQANSDIISAMLTDGPECPGAQIVQPPTLTPLELKAFMEQWTRTPR